MNYLVETKKEFTIQLVNILSPLIFDGMVSIYDFAKKTSKPNEELMNFQKLLKRVLHWNPEMLNTETQRILSASNCPELLTDLVNAIIKANIMVLTNTPPEKKDTLKITFHIEFSNFVHKTYIETARNVYQNPFLFYHEYTLYDLKRNQRDAMELIRASIKEAIRKMLPLKLILKEYLGSSFEATSPKKSDFDKAVTEDERNQLNAMATAVNQDGGKLEKYSLEKRTETEHKHTTEKPEVEYVRVDPAQKPKLVEDDADSVSYYRKPTVEDSFSNHRSMAPVKAVAINKNTSFKDSYSLDITEDGGTDIESIRKRIGERFRRNAPDFYKV
jgi:hypothetical protein